MSFNDARTYVHKLKLTNQNEWKKFTKSDLFPEFIPVAPDQIYRNKGWISLGDWLGTNRIASHNKIHRDFEEAREFVRNLKLKSFAEWQEYCKSGEKPEDIPTAVHRIYKNQGWKGINDWLGTGIDPRYADFLPFGEARAIVHKLKLKNTEEWRSYCKSAKRPLNIPKDPEKRYKNSGWVGYGDWLGSGTIAPFLIKYREFNKARKFARSLKLKNVKEWMSYCKTEDKPNDIPTAAHSVYKTSGWISYGDWLGTDSISNWSKDFLPLNKARTYVRKVGLKTVAEWKVFSKTKQFPKNIPVAPDQIYKSSGWLGWDDFLGKK